MGGDLKVRVIGAAQLIALCASVNSSEDIFREVLKKESEYLALQKEDKQKLAEHLGYRNFDSVRWEYITRGGYLSKKPPEGPTGKDYERLILYMFQVRLEKAMTLARKGKEHIKRLFEELEELEEKIRRKEVR